MDHTKNSAHLVVVNLMSSITYPFFSHFSEIVQSIIVYSSPWLPVILHPPVRWPYTREVVPDALVRAGLPLEDWEAAFDIAHRYWKRQRVARRMEVGCILTSCSSYAFLFVVLYPLHYIVVQRNGLSVNLFYTLYAVLGILIFRVHIRFFPQVIPREKPFSAALDQLEEDCSLEVQELNNKYREFGIHVFRRPVNLGFHDDDDLVRLRSISFPDSAGLRFSFILQPADKEEVAWIIANSVYKSKSRVVHSYLPFSYRKVWTREVSSSMADHSDDFELLSHFNDGNVFDKQGFNEKQALLVNVRNAFSIAHTRNMRAIWMGQSRTDALQVIVV